MTSPVDPAGDAVVRDTVADAASVSVGADVQAAQNLGASSAASLAASGGAPSAVDADALLAQVQALAGQLQSLQAAHAASQPAPPAEPEPVKLTDIAAGQGAAFQHLASIIEDRLRAVEDFVKGKSE
jgi:hypothetical protein